MWDHLNCSKRSSWDYHTNNQNYFQSIFNNLHGLGLKQLHYFPFFPPQFSVLYRKNRPKYCKYYKNMICIFMYLAVADCKWNTRFQPITHFDQYSGTKNQLKAKFTGQTKGLLKKFRPQCGFKQNLGSMTGPRWASCTELEFAYNRKKKLPLKTVEMWDRGGNGPGAEKRLPLSYLCIFGREIKYTHRNLALVA